VRVTAPSTCPWLDHPVSGLIHATCRPIQTRFRCAYTYRLKLATKIKSLTHYARGTPSEARRPEGRRLPPTACRHPVSGTISLPALGCFSPFPHGTGSLSVTEEYLGLEGGPPMFRQDFTCPALLEDRSALLPVRGCHPLWPDFPDGSGSTRSATGLVRVRSPLLTESRLMSFPPVTEMFQFTGFASHGYVFTMRYRRSGGFPHSEILGSKPARSSPGLIATCYVLHRLSVPRHSPDALLTLESQGLHVQATACHRACARGDPRNTQPPSHPGLCSHPRLKGASGRLGNPDLFTMSNSAAATICGET